MTAEEVNQIASILQLADGGCYHCAGELFRRFNEAFPGFDAVLDENWAQERGGDRGSWMNED